MYCTYIMESLVKPGMRYIGHTSDLKKRIKAHDAGSGHHIKKYGPWKLRLYMAFETLEQAQKFERYLKTGSNPAFANRHFWI